MKCGFEIQIQNIKIPNANIKRENPNLDSELDANIIVNWTGFPQFLFIFNNSTRQIDIILHLYIGISS